MALGDLHTTILESWQSLEEVCVCVHPIEAVQSSPHTHKHPHEEKKEDWKSILHALFLSLSLYLTYRRGARVIKHVCDVFN